MSEARAGIANTLSRYAWAYDMDELDQIGECYTADAEVTFRDTGVKVGREAVVLEMRRRRSKYADGSIPWHVISNIYIPDPTADEPVVVSWWTFFVEAPDGTQTFAGVGWYDDVFALEDAIWRIKRRRVLSARDR
jgi:3-phenylpropionate/cinnamic acid dioxygenase small subunit